MYPRGPCRAGLVRVHGVCRKNYASIVVTRLPAAAATDASGDYRVKEICRQYAGYYYIRWGSRHSTLTRQTDPNFASRRERKPGTISGRCGRTATALNQLRACVYPGKADVNFLQGQSGKFFYRPNEIDRYPKSLKLIPIFLFFNQIKSSRLKYKVATSKIDPQNPPHKQVFKLFS